VFVSQPMKIFPLLVVLLVVLGLGVSAQNAQKALKFDEFSLAEAEYYWPLETASDSKRLDRFTLQAKSLRSSKFYIVTYSRRQFTEATQRRLSNWASQAQMDLVFRARIPQENVSIIDGGFRDNDTLEFWIGSKKSTPPEPTPSYSRAESKECPDVHVVEDGMNLDENKPVGFTITNLSKSTWSYIWSTSSGNIVGNPTSSSVLVDTKGAKRVTVYANIIEAPIGCASVAYGTFNVGLRPYLVDRGERVSISDLKARFQNFASEKASHPEMTALILAYSGRAYPGNQNRTLRMITTIATFLRIDMSYFKMIDAGVRENDAFEFWLVPSGVAEPKPSPSVDRALLEATPASKKTRPRK
jgi:hypothetical protein